MPEPDFPSEQAKVGLTMAMPVSGFTCFRMAVSSKGAAVGSGDVVSIDGMTATNPRHGRPVRPPMHVETCSGGFRSGRGGGVQFEKEWL